MNHLEATKEGEMDATVITFILGFLGSLIAGYLMGWLKRPIDEEWRLRHD